MHNKNLLDICKKQVLQKWANALLRQAPVWPDKNRQMSIKIAQKWFHSKMIDFDTFKKLPKNVGDSAKLIAAKGFKNLPKVQ